MRLASYRVPYWWAFVIPFPVLTLGFVVFAVWTGDLWALLLWLLIVALVVDGMEYRTLYRLEVDDGMLIAKSVMRRWAIPLMDIKEIRPGWCQPWWKRKASVYTVKRRSGRPLFIWCGKGLNDFLTCVGSVEPALLPRPEDGQSRAERSRGKSGFTHHQAA